MCFFKAPTIDATSAGNLYNENHKTSRSLDAQMFTDIVTKTRGEAKLFQNCARGRGGCPGFQTGERMLVPKVRFGDHFESTGL